MNRMSAAGCFDGGLPGYKDIEPDPLEILGEAAALVPMGAFSCDLETNRLSWTDGLFDIFGLARDRIPDRQQILEQYRQDSAELLERERSHAIRTGSGFSLDACIDRPDGTRRWVRITASTRSSYGRTRTLYGMKQDVTEDRIRWEIMRQKAECDPLTGVGNRARFENFLQKRDFKLAISGVGALALFDLDGFKQINDNWGHAAGDACLVTFGKRLRETFPNALLISRIGGDEFAVLLPRLGTREEMRAAIERSIGGLAHAVPWQGDMLPFGLSVGLACKVPGDGHTPDELYAAADRVLYDAKKTANLMLACA